MINYCSCLATNCPEPKLQGGSVTFNGNSAQSLAMYRCEEGSSLIGISVRQCQTNGTWTGTDPKCIGKQLEFIKPKK